MSDKETLFARWLNGDLSSSELEQLKASGELEELQTLIEATKQATLPAYDLDQAYDQFRAKYPVKQVKVRSLNTRWIVGVAAGVLLLITAIFLLQNPTTTTTALYGTNETISYPDQSSVILNDGSSVKYNEKKWTQERLVELTGEAYFSVEKSTTPFNVKTKNGTVEVLGTQFNVRAWDNTFQVECYEGKVKVNQNGQETILIAKEKVRFIEGVMEEVEKINYDVPKWTTGITSFEAEDVEKVLAELERQYNVEVIHDMKGRNFKGAFPNDDLEEAVRIIGKILEVNMNITPDRKRIFIE